MSIAYTHSHTLSHGEGERERSTHCGKKYESTWLQMYAQTHRYLILSARSLAVELI